MKDVFDFKRFGKYFLYDLNNARGNYLVTAVTLGLLPLILLMFHVIFSLIFTGSVGTVLLPLKVVLLCCVLLICILSAPAKLYGGLTERRMGSDWLLIPASSFEKFLSMAIMLCIVLPVVVLGLFSICDVLLSWILPSYYGESLLSTIANGWNTISSEISDSMDNVMSISAPAFYDMLWLSWCSYILPFGLGAIIFKKGKAAKTILCLVGIQMVFSIIFTLWAMHGFNGDAIADWFTRNAENMTAAKAQAWINSFINISFLIVVGGLLTGLFFRVKTIKQ